MFTKHFLGAPLLILVRLMPVLLSMPQRGDLCPDFPIAQKQVVTVHINSTSGTRHCCRRIFCPAGTEVRYCSHNNPNDTECVKCKEGFYSPDSLHSDSNPRCISWTNCSYKLGLVSNNDGSSIRRGTCRCDVARGYYLGNWDSCDKQTKKCEPDHELDVETGECQACRAGFQQLQHGYGPCEPCPPNTQKLNGDFNCTPCPPGTMKVKEGYGKCQTCKQLIEDGTVNIKCENLSKENSTPIALPVRPEEKGFDEMLVIVPVVCVIVLLVIALILGLLLHRRRKQEKEKRKRSPRNSPLHSTNPLGPNYRAVPDNSTSSSDSTSHSSAEDALEAEKTKAQNMANQTATVTNEKSGVPRDDVNTDYAPPPPPHGHAPNGHAPNGHIPNGQPNGYVHGYPNPQEPGGLLIFNPSNCNISLGQGTQLHMTPAVPAAAPAAAPVHQLNNLNKPRSRQSAPPTVELGGQSASPLEDAPYGVHAAPFSGPAPYYEDEADRIDAYYNGRSDC